MRYSHVHAHELHNRSGPAQSSLPRTWTVASSMASLASLAKVQEPQSPTSTGKQLEVVLTVVYVAFWMGSNLAVLLLNKLLLSYWSFKQPVLLTFLHMISGAALTWGLASVNLLSIQRVQSRAQLLKLVGLSTVFALAVLSANMSLKFLAVSMNQAIGAATPVFAALFAFILQGARERGITYGTLALVVGGVVLASGVEPDLHVFGATICFLAAAFRGLRAVLQAMLLRPEEKLDSISCLAYMAPISTLLMLALALFEPGAPAALAGLPWAGAPMLVVLFFNCSAAFFSNYLNMVVTKRTSALSIQVLGQCKGILSAIVSVLCFHNVVPVFGWVGYGITVVGCIAYGRCKAHFRALAEAAAAGSAFADEDKAWPLVAANGNSKYATSSVATPMSSPRNPVLTGSAATRSPTVLLESLNDNVLAAGDLHSRHPHPAPAREASKALYFDVPPAESSGRPPSAPSQHDDLFAGRGAGWGPPRGAKRGPSLGEGATDASSNSLRSLRIPAGSPVRSSDQSGSAESTSPRQYSPSAAAATMQVRYDAAQAARKALQHTGLHSAGRGLGLS